MKIEDELYPAEYYHPPATLQASDYVEKLMELKKRGDNIRGIDDVLDLFKDLKAGHARAWDVMHALPHGDDSTYRDWLAWRVVSEAIQYFSRMWRHDSCFLRYYDEYRMYVDEGIRTHTRWKL